MREKRKKGYFISVEIFEGFIGGERTVGSPEDNVTVVDLEDKKGRELKKSIHPMLVIKSTDVYIKRLEDVVEFLQLRIEALKKEQGAKNKE